MSSMTSDERRKVVALLTGAAILLDELTMEVLMRFPVKSIVLFRVVCHSWATALSCH
jgi:hypothetical protein